MAKKSVKSQEVVTPPQPAPPKPTSPTDVKRKKRPAILGGKNSGTFVATQQFTELTDATVGTENATPRKGDTRHTMKIYEED